MKTIKIDTIDNLVHGVSEALDICEEYLLEWTNDYGDDGDAIEKFVQENYSDDNRIHDIYFCHLSKMLEPPSELLPLNVLLLKESALSRFLKEYDIEFIQDQTGIAIKHRGIVWNSSNVKTGNGLLERRLGYGKSLDYQVCGFLFSAGIEKEENSYFETLKGGAEFLQCLDLLLGTKTLSSFAQKARYYLVECTVPINSAYFLFGPEEYESIEQKERVYLSECIRYIFANKYNSKLRNPIIELRGLESIPVCSYRELH